MSDKYKDEISEIIKRSNSRRPSAAQMDSIAERIENTDHPAMHKKPIVDIQQATEAMNILPTKTRSRRSSIATKENENFKTRVVGARMPIALYEEFAKIAASRHLTPGKLSSIIIEEFLASQPKSK